MQASDGLPDASDIRSRFDTDSLRRVKAELEGELQESGQTQAVSGRSASSATTSPSSGLRRSASVAPERPAPRAQSTFLDSRADEATAPRRASIATSGGLYERGLQAQERLERARQRALEEIRRAANPRLNP